MKYLKSFGKRHETLGYAPREGAEGNNYQRSNLSV